MVRASSKDSDLRRSLLGKETHDIPCVQLSSIAESQYQVAIRVYLSVHYGHSILSVLTVLAILTVLTISSIQTRRSRRSLLSSRTLWSWRSFGTYDLFREALG